jgi:subtilisin family serine protease
MKRRTQFVAGFVLLLAAAHAVAQNRFILHPAPNVSAGTVAGRHGLTVLGPLDDQNRGLYVVTAPAALPVAQVMKDVSSDSAVLSFEQDLRLAVAESSAALNQSTAAILDSLPAPSAVSYYGSPVLGAYLSQPAVGLIRLGDTQTTFGATGAGIVAIIDTGVDPNHVALKNSLVPGYDFVNNAAGMASEMTDVSPSTASVLNQSTASILDKTQVAVVNQSTAAILDPYTVSALSMAQLPPAFGHGTMVAGIVHLTAPTAKIMPLKAFRGDGSATLSDILRAIYYAADHGANVINMSFSLLTPSVELVNAINYAEHKNITCVASTGNLGLAFVTHPAALQKVIAVASTSNQDTRSSFSSYGGTTWVGAPGEGVITTYPGNNYAAAWGTSFSAPFVSGTSALVFQVRGRSDYSETSNAVSKALKLTPDLGRGRLDVYQAISQEVSPSGP